MPVTTSASHIATLGCHTKSFCRPRHAGPLAARFMMISRALLQARSCWHYAYAYYASARTQHQNQANRMANSPASVCWYGNSSEFVSPDFSCRGVHYSAHVAGRPRCMRSPTPRYPDPYHASRLTWQSCCRACKQVLCQACVPRQAAVWFSAKARRARRVSSSTWGDTCRGGWITQRPHSAEAANTAVRVQLNATVRASIPTIQVNAACTDIVEQFATSRASARQRLQDQGYAPYSSPLITDHSNLTLAGYLQLLPR